MTIPTSKPPRHLPIVGTHNFRDAGGYPTPGGTTVRSRTLFRSDSLHALTPAGISAVRALGLRSTIDLRGEPEVARWPSDLSTSAGIPYRHLPLTAKGTSPEAPVADNLEEINRMFLDLGGASLRSVLESMAAPGTFPTLVHCSVGKDRTGLVVALLLELAGVPRQHIVDDYGLTGQHAMELIAEIYEANVRNGREPLQFARLMECRPEVMEETLEYLDTRYGGAESYMRGIGVSTDTIATLREALVESE